MSSVNQPNERCLHVYSRRNLYSVRAEAVDAFVRSIREGGDWQRVARRVTPDLVASDLLEHQSSPSPVFLCIDFWVSPERYQSVRESPV